MKPLVQKARCAWVSDDPLFLTYHDEEWGIPVHDDRLFFEQLVLSGTQAGLSWAIVLRKRENYRKAFDNFEAHRVARYTPRKIELLLKNEGIIRNRQKIKAAITNAKAFLKVQNEFGSFDHYVWDFVGGKPIHNRIKTLRDIPTRSPESDSLSIDLKKRGFSFIGTTICYAFMQGCGLINDHAKGCFRYPIKK